MFIFVVVVSQTDTSKGNKNILSHGVLGISFFPVFFFFFFFYCISGNYRQEFNFVAFVKAIFD